MGDNLKNRSLEHGALSLSTTPLSLFNLFLHCYWNMYLFFFIIFLSCFVLFCFVFFVYFLFFSKKKLFDLIFGGDDGHLPAIFHLILKPPARMWLAPPRWLLPIGSSLAPR